MKNEKATFAQMMFSIVLFNFGSSVVMGISGSVAQDAWAAILLGAVCAVPLFCVYARLFRLFPEKGLFEILEIIFGKVGGKILTVIFIWYALHLCSIILGNFTIFTQTASMPETPQLPIMILMILTTAYLARSSMRAIGKWAMVAIFLVVFVVLLTFVTAIPQLKWDALLPVFEHPPAQIAQAAFDVFSFPYAESVLFLCLAGSFSKKDNPYKLFLFSLLIILGVFIVVIVRNITLMGTTLSSMNYFPSYMMARIIGIGDFLARIEGSISSNFLFAGIVKIAVCLLAASKGIASLFNLEDYRSVVLPTGLLAMAICASLYKNVMGIFAFIPYYPYYAFLFQVILPLAVWIAGEIYVKKHPLSEVPA